MSNFPREGLDGIVNISAADGDWCLVKVDPKSAQSLVQFLLHKEIELDPPEGGVARDPKYQVEMGGVPEMHSFWASGSAEDLKKLVAEWESSPARSVA